MPSLFRLLDHYAISVLLHFFDRYSNNEFHPVDKRLWDCPRPRLFPLSSFWQQDAIPILLSKSAVPILLSWDLIVKSEIWMRSSRIVACHHPAIPFVGSTSVENWMLPCGQGSSMLIPFHIAPKLNYGMGSRADARPTLWKTPQSVGKANRQRNRGDNRSGLRM